MVGIRIQSVHVQHKEVILLPCSVIMRRQIHNLSDMLMKQLLITLIGLCRANCLAVLKLIFFQH